MPDVVICHTMTDENIRRLVEHRVRESESITERVFDAVRILGSPLPNDIKKYLDGIIPKEIQVLDQRTGISDIGKESVENHVKKRTISMRTIMRKLRKLVEEARLDHANNRYSVKDELKSDIRIFAPQFGGSALSNMMKGYYPLFNTLEQNLEDLIKALGVYIIYCFAEAARPVPGSAVDKDRLASFWIQNVFSPLNMYIYFLALVSNQPNDNEVKKILRKNFKKFKDGLRYVDDNGKVVPPTSIQQLALERFRRITSGSEYNKYENKDKPMYELDTKTVEKIFYILGKKYRYQYEQLLETSSYFLKGPKEEVLDRTKKEGSKQKK